MTPRLPLVLFLTVVAAFAADAQTPAPPASNLILPGTAAGLPIMGNADPVVASVDGYPINLRELGQALQTLPEPLKGLPFDSVYPVLVDRMVDHQALVIMAKRTGIEDRPDVQREIKLATERILESAYLSREAVPKVSDQAVLAAYNRQFAGRPATEEARARHILVATEAEARKIIEELRQGADFAVVARTLSKDPDGKNGGDLGFFRREQVWPAFADMAFTLQPGQIGNNPVRNEFGWHVVKVEERRLVASPGFSDIQAQLRQELLAQAVQQVIDKARSQVIVRRFNLDGSDLETGPRFKSSIAPDELTKETPLQQQLNR